MVAPLTLEKTQLRIKVIAERDGADVAWRQRASEHISTRLTEHHSFADAKVVASYFSFRAEFNTAAFNAEVLALGKRLLLPRMIHDPNDLQFHEVVSLDQHFIAGDWGILEPDPKHCRELDIKEADLILVPGVAFDRAGNRLGYGGGFYDRVLARAKPKTTRIAGAFHMQLLEHVPTGPTDQSVDCVVTEVETVSIRSSA